ncbi:MAG: TlpA family protein disulfide reductase [Flavobacteriales bacterium]|jgi:thiol-disulfide isomerase/thioredoxin|nr:MAG: TlpA family protein disulfide reductase [Flavobacteriales bacterium]
MFDSSRTVPAPPLRVSRWIDAEGHPSAPLKLTDLGEGFKVIYCFQHWCPGCHSHGFPTLKTLVNKLSGHGFGFAAVQTVFEGAQTNTFERLRENQERYGLAIPFGHDAAEGRYPTVMADYRTRGTPWFIVLDPMGEVLHSDFRLDADALVRAFGRDHAVARAA